MTPRVWRAEPGEAPDVARLLIGFRDHLGKDWPPDEAFRVGVEELLVDEQTDYLLAAVGDGQPLGVCQLRYRHGLWLDGLDCLLEDLFVEEAARGTGLGRALVAGAREHALARGARRMELDVNEANPAALALYAAFGFVSESTAFDGARDLYMQVHLPRE